MPTYTSLYFRFIGTTHSLQSRNILILWLCPVAYLAHLCARGIPILGYLDDLLLWEQSREDLQANVHQVVEVLQGFNWVLNVRQLTLEQTRQCEYLELV